MSEPARAAGRLTWRDSRPIIVGEIAALMLFPILIGIAGQARTVVPLIIWSIAALWLQGKSARALGLELPRFWQILAPLGILMGIAAAVAYRIFIPIDGAPSLPSLGLPQTLVILASMWVLAAIGEEWVYRGYILGRLQVLFGGSSASGFAAVCLSAVIFALAHELSGIGSFAMFAALGMIEGGLYLLTRRNLLVPILFHGSWDTTLFLLAILLPQA